MVNRDRDVVLSGMSQKLIILALCPGRHVGNLRRVRRE